MSYDELVAHDRVTCEACPYQVEGELADGREFYFRYRWGHATLAVGDDCLGRADVGEQVGNGLDGYMDPEQYREVFERLYARVLSEGVQDD